MTIHRFWLCLLLLPLFPAVRAQDSPPVLIIETQGPSATIRKVIFNAAQDELISLGDDKAIRFWDIETGELRSTMRGQIGEGLEGAIFAADLSPDGRWLAVGGYNVECTVHIIDLTTREIAAVLRGHTDNVSSLSFSDDGLFLASASGDASVRVWNVEGLAEAESLLEITESQILEGHSEMVQTVHFGPGGTHLVSGGDDHTAILWSREGPTKCSRPAQSSRGTRKPSPARCSPHLVA